MMTPGTFAMLGTVVAPPLHANVASSCVPADTDDASKKIRKPYTITKSRESWTEQEHDKFLEALQLFDRDWKKIEAFVGSKSVIQIRSHAQKYFLKVQKNGSGEHVPPPRPKRKSALPYPQKASKSALVTQRASGSIMPLVSQAEPTYNFTGQSCTVFAPPVSPPALSAWVHHIVPPANVAFMAKGTPATDFGAMSQMPEKDSSGSNGEGFSAHQPPQVLSVGQERREACLRATPDFAEVYSFIGSVFDPSVSGHLKKMKEMAPIDLETVLLLMKNLSINLSSPDFEEHKLFLSVYDMCSIDSRAAAQGSAENQEVGDDISVSCQPGLTQLSESTDADSHSECQQQASLLQSYPQGTPVIPRQSCLPYDGGGGSIGAITNVSKVLSGVSTSSQLRMKPSINLQHSSLRLQRGENMPAGNEVHRLEVQRGSY